MKPLAAGSPPQGNPLLTNLWSFSASQRADALERIIETPSLEHTQTLIVALSDPGDQVRTLAILGLQALALAQPQLMRTVRRLLGRRVSEDSSHVLRSLAETTLQGLLSPEKFRAPRRSPPLVAVGPAVAGPTLPAVGRRRRFTKPATTPFRPTDCSSGFREQSGYEDDEAQYYREDDEQGDEEASGSLEAAEEALVSLGPIEADVLRLIGLVGAGKEAVFQPRMAHLLGPGRYAKLRLQLGASAASPVTQATRDFLEGHGLSLPFTELVESLGGLALRAWQRAHGESPAPLVDWEAITPLLLAALREAPVASSQEIVILAFYEAITEGPDSLRATLTRSPWHPGWAPLGLWLAGRSAEQFGQPLTRDFGQQGAVGSTLAQECVLRGQKLLLSYQAPFQLSGWYGSNEAQARLLIGCGGGTIRTLDYPAFRVVSREVLVDTDPERSARLRALLFEGLAPIYGLFSENRTLFEQPREESPHPLRSLFSRLQPATWAALDSAESLRLERVLHRSILAYLGLRRLATESHRVSRHQLISFWFLQESRDTVKSVCGSSRYITVDQQIEAMVMALLSELHQTHVADKAQQAALKELFIEAIRTLAACYHWETPSSLLVTDPRFFVDTINSMLRVFDHAPLELVQALSLDARQGLPKLRGGTDRSLEATFRRLHRESLRGRRGRGAAAIYECRVISHEAALGRGLLGRDCSSSSVPLRALSPHHVYYGIFDEKGEQQPGYLTVYEAWGTTEGGEPEPVLCLETINEPRGLLAGASQDLLVLFEAIAHSRGLAPGLVLITGRGTWNFANGRELACCRRAAHGSPIWLSPADPVVWRIYSGICQESFYYSAFDTSRGKRALLRPGSRHFAPAVRLAPPEEVDQVQPENLEEARRLRALPPRQIRITARDARGPIGFISE